MIEPKYQTLNGLFSDRVFRIPKYQRFYSWERKQRDDLFSDIRELAKKGEDRHHFMAKTRRRLEGRDLHFDWHGQVLLADNDSDVGTARGYRSDPTTVVDRCDARIRAL